MGVLLTVCRRRSQPSLPPPSRSRLLLHLRGSTLSGLVDPSCLPSQPSNRCGLQSRSMTSAALPLSTGSASKQYFVHDIGTCRLDLNEPSHDIFIHTTHTSRKYKMKFKKKKKKKSKKKKKKKKKKS